MFAWQACQSIFTSLLSVDSVDSVDFVDVLEQAGRNRHFMALALGHDSADKFG